jgi:REP element-mobilizing transposase RayT
MSRAPRVERAGIYHILNRGVEKRNIFLDDGDCLKFLSLIESFTGLYCLELLAHCLMSNHYHLLVKTSKENISYIMQNLNHSYTLYFNRKYNRVGTLWQGRFTSRYVYDEKYLLVLMKYIEQNPIRAGICTRVGDYPWASAITQQASMSIGETRILAEFNSNRNPCTYNLGGLNSSNTPDIQKTMNMLAGLVEPGSPCRPDHTRDPDIPDGLDARNYPDHPNNPVHVDQSDQSDQSDPEAHPGQGAGSASSARLFNQKSLHSYLEQPSRNQGIMAALAAGFRQTQIANELGLSTGCISGIVKHEGRKQRFFARQLASGMFHTDRQSISLYEMGESVFIKQVLASADTTTISELHRLFGKRKVYALWLETVRQ